MVLRGGTDFRTITLQNTALSPTVSTCSYFPVYPQWSTVELTITADSGSRPQIHTEDYILAVSQLYSLKRPANTAFECLSVFPR